MTPEEIIHRYHALALKREFEALRALYDSPEGEEAFWLGDDGQKDWVTAYGILLPAQAPADVERWLEIQSILLEFDRRLREGSLFEDRRGAFEYLKDEFTEDVQRDASREQLNSYRTSMRTQATWYRDD